MMISVHINGFNSGVTSPELDIRPSIIYSPRDISHGMSSFSKPNHIQHKITEEGFN